MAFASIIMVFMAIIFVVLGVLFVLGLILLGVGIVKRKNPKNKGKKHPVVFMVVGTILSLPALGAILLIFVKPKIMDTKLEMERAQYECVPDKWRNEHVYDHEAAQEVLDALLKAADEGDKEAFAKNFTPDIQEKSDFEEALDLFFESYPQGFSECGIEVGPVSGGGSYNFGHNVLTAGTSVDVVMDGEWYTIGLGFCYENTDNPEEVGVNDFSIMNMEGAAYFNEEYNKNSIPFHDEYLVCRIMSDKEISACLIGGIPYLWTDTPEPKLTKEEMSVLLNQYRDEGIGIPEVVDVIGEPNASRKLSNCTGYDYYYELVPKEDGTPQYVHISTIPAKGRIIDAFLCDSEREYYDNPIVEFIKSE